MHDDAIVEVTPAITTALDQHVAADLRIHAQKPVSGLSASRRGGIASERSRRCHRGLGARELRAVVDPITSSRRPDARWREGRGAGDLDEVGQVEFVAGVVVAHRVEHVERMRAQERIGPALQRRIARSASLASFCSRIATRAPSFRQGGRSRRDRSPRTERDDPAPSARPARQTFQARALSSGTSA